MTIIQTSGPAFFTVTFLHTHSQNSLHRYYEKTYLTSRLKLGTVKTYPLSHITGDKLVSARKKPEYEVFLRPKEINKSNEKNSIRGLVSFLYKIGKNQCCLLLVVKVVIKLFAKMQPWRWDQIWQSTRNFAWQWNRKAPILRHTVIVIHRLREALAGCDLSYVCIICLNICLLLSWYVWNPKMLKGGQLCKL